MTPFTCSNDNLCLCHSFSWLLSLAAMTICVCVIASQVCFHLQQWQSASNDHLWVFHLQQWKPMWKPLTTTFTCSNGNLSKKSLMITFTCCNGSLYKKEEKKKEKTSLVTLIYTAMEIYLKGFLWSLSLAAMEVYVNISYYYFLLSHRSVVVCGHFLQSRRSVAVCGHFHFV